MVIGRRKVVIAALLALLLFASVTHAAVDITFFQATWDGDNVQVTWRTGNETDHSSFQLWRSEENVQIVNGQISNQDALSRVNTSPINSPNPCSVTGQEYSYLDLGVPEDAQTIYYYLESFNGCSNANRDFIGDGSGGWRLDAPITLPTPTFTPTPTPTPTLTPQPSATATNRPAVTATLTPQPSATTTPNPSVTAQPSNTPAPTNTLAPGVSPSPATATLTPSATQRGSTAATATSLPARTATRQAAAPGASPTLNTRPPVSTPGTDLPTATVPPTLTPSLTEPENELTPIPIIESPTLFATETMDPAVAVILPTAAPTGETESMSALPQAATPTLPSVLLQPLATRAVATPVPVSSGYENFIRGLISMILLTAMALGGYIGWLYLRHR